MFSKRDIFLMREAMKAAAYYKDIDSWLNEVVSDGGHTVEQHLSYDADRITEQESNCGEMTRINQETGQYD